MAALKESDKSNSKLLEALGISQRMDLNKRYLKPLLDCGAIVMSKPEHPNNPKQKYKITEYGKRLLGNKDG